MTDAQDTLKDRLDHAECLVGTFLSAEMHERITPRLTDALLWSLQELLEQAQAAFQEMCQQSRPDTPVMCCGEPIPDLEKELIAVMREMTSELEDVVVTGRGMLDDIDKRDKANEETGGAS